MSGDPRYRIFLSCGTPYNSAQEEFLSAVEDLLRSRRCEPQTVGRSVYTHSQPVRGSCELISDCSGAVVIAFERLRISAAIERPGSARELEVHDWREPTVWNHMEAAMAYARELPILTIVERGVRRQGMLSERMEWVAIETEVDKTLLLTPRFQQAFEGWLKKVEMFSTKQNKILQASSNSTSLNLGDMTIKDILLQLKLEQIMKISGSLTGLISLVAAAAYAIAKHGF